ncbi:MAG: ABC transporter permease subunit [Tepidisphaeraceae bacterium]
MLVYLYASEPNPPAHFIQPGSYNATNNTLFVQGENKIYGLAMPVAVKLDGNAATMSVLNGRFAVDNMTTAIQGSTKIISAIELSRVPGRIDSTQTHQLLLGLVIVEFAAILLVITNASASAVTREREDGTLDLLLTTPITSRYYLWGKLTGLIAFVLPLLIVPVVSVMMFVVADLMKAGWSGNTPETWLVLPEGAILLPLVGFVVVAFAAIVGMQMSLRNRTTVRAVMSGLGIVAGAIALVGWCGFSAANSRMGSISSVIQALSPLGVIGAVVYPTRLGGPAWGSGNPADVSEARLLLVLATILTTAAYAAGVWAMYRSMVKNFDMTIRRQSR